jgi:hypothetical protein
MTLRANNSLTTASLIQSCYSWWEGRDALQQSSKIGIRFLPGDNYISQSECAYAVEAREFVDLRIIDESISVVNKLFDL